MSKIHQAMLRAEKEASAKGVFSSGARERPAQGAIAPKQSSLRSNIGDLVLPEKESRLAVQPAIDLSDLVQKSTVPDSRLVALSSGIYDALRDKLLCAKADARTSGNDLKSVLLTSAGVGDGKSLTAANLSISISRERGDRVLLVDANLRAPSIHHLLGIDQENGLSGVLQGVVATNQAIFRTDISGLCVVTAGSRVENPTELLNTRKMSDFLALAKEEFDWVFLDSPSLMPDPDADLMASMVDAVVLVTRSSPACASSLRDGMQLLQGRNVLGVVLNDADARGTPHGAKHLRDRLSLTITDANS